MQNRISDYEKGLRNHHGYKDPTVYAVLMRTNRMARPKIQKGKSKIENHPFMIAAMRDSYYCNCNMN